MYGWREKVLRVDLSRGKISEESLSPQVCKDYIGGRGVGMYYLLREVNPLCDPLGKENTMFMVAGPLTGTSANISGGAAPLTAQAVADQLGDRIDVIIDGGRCRRRTTQVGSDRPRQEEPACCALSPSAG